MSRPDDRGRLEIEQPRAVPNPLHALHAQQHGYLNVVGLRGPASCGKSTLMQAVVQTLTLDEVLYLSRLTPQALYFLPADARASWR